MRRLCGRLRPLIVIDEDEEVKAILSMDKSWLQCLEPLQEIVFNIEQDMGGKRSGGTFCLQFCNPDSIRTCSASEWLSAVDEECLNLDTCSTNFPEFRQKLQDLFISRTKLKEHYSTIDDPVACIHVVSVTKEDLKDWLLKYPLRLGQLDKVEMLHVLVLVVPTTHSIDVDGKHRLAALIRDNVPSEFKELFFDLDGQVPGLELFEFFLKNFISKFLVPYVISAISKGVTKNIEQVESTSRIGKMLFSIGKRFIAQGSQETLPYQEESERKVLTRSFDLALLFGLQSSTECPNWFIHRIKRFYHVAQLRNTIAIDYNAATVTLWSTLFDIIVEPNNDLELLLESAALMIELTDEKNEVVQRTLGKEQHDIIDQFIGVLNTPHSLILALLLSWACGFLLARQSRRSFFYLSRAYHIAKPLALVRPMRHKN